VKNCFIELFLLVLTLIARHRTRAQQSKINRHFNDSTNSDPIPIINDKNIINIIIIVNKNLTELDFDFLLLSA